MDRRAVLLVLGGLAFLALGFLFFSHNQSNARQFFSDALRSYGISTEVTVNGRLLTIREGIVTSDGKEVSGTSSYEALRLAYARTLAERSPFFALPGTSPEDLTYAVNELQETENLLADIQKDTESAQLIRSSLYPIDFLHKAALAEAARLEFITHTNVENEKAYTHAVREEFFAYVADVKNFKNAASRAIPNTTPPYVAAGKLISKTSLLSGLELIIESSRETKRRFDARILCEHGIISFCNAQDLALPTLPDMDTTPISGESLQAAHSVQALYADIVDGTEQRLAPLIALSTSVCVSDSPLPPIFNLSIRHDENGSPPLRRGVYVGDIRLIDIGTYGNLPFYSNLGSRGINFVLSPPLLHYECMDEARDLSSILFTEEVMREATPQSRVYYQSDAMRIANSLARAGDSKGIQYVLSSRNNSSHFDQLLRDISWIEQINVNLLKNGVEAELKTYNLFFSRSGFVSLFAVNNPSFVGNLSLFEDISIPASEKPYVYYSHISDAKKRADVRKDLRSYMSIHFEQVPYF